MREQGEVRALGYFTLYTDSEGFAAFRECFARLDLIEHMYSPAPWQGNFRPF